MHTCRPICIINFISRTELNLTSKSLYSSNYIRNMTQGLISGTAGGLERQRLVKTGTAVLPEIVYWDKPREFGRNKGLFRSARKVSKSDC